MKKKFILWLCEVFQVDLVEPVDQVTQINVRHEMVPYTKIQHQVSFSKQYLSMDMQENIVIESKRTAMLKCLEQMQKENIITFEEVVQPLGIDSNNIIRCTFYAAPYKVN